MVRMETEPFCIIEMCPSFWTSFWGSWSPCFLNQVRMLEYFEVQESFTMEFRFLATYLGYWYISEQELPVDTKARFEIWLSVFLFAA